MFVDEVDIRLRAGKGGDGCISFRRERHRPKGGPDGGDGGRGGNIILECDGNVADLSEFKYKPHASAGNGSNGKGGNRNGRDGDDRILRIPAGNGSDLDFERITQGGAPQSWASIAPLERWKRGAGQSPLQELGKSGSTSFHSG